MFLSRRHLPVSFQPLLGACGGNAKSLCLGTRMSPPDPVASFLARWSNVAASERATAQTFLNELCDLLGVERPANSEVYQFERPIAFVQPGGKRTTRFIDLYKRGCFVLEAKKYDERQPETDALALLVEEEPPARKNKIIRGTGRWDDAMLRAFDQAERYAHHLPNSEPAPAFLIIVDIGHVIELYADFSQKGRNYVAFPDSRSHRISLADLTNPEVRERLRLVWTDPPQLDPARRTTKVTLEVARHLAVLAKSLEEAGNRPKLVAEFLCRCLFCMFAEDVGLLAKNSFRGFLESMRGDPHQFVPLMQALFKEMDKGASISMLLRQKLLRFNGGLFAEQTVLPVNSTQLGLLIEAARCEWRHVEPAIFGTLLEQALEPDERGRLGAHFTPRAYVERLVLPTVIEPLRADWRAVRDEAVVLAKRGDLKQASKRVRAFHQKLCGVRVLDPACGSGNFLYVTLEHMKRLEGGVLDQLHQFGDDTTPENTVDPHQFLGLELNGRAVAIAELVLWIGYLQWHFRVHGNVLPAEPVLKKFDNIVERDAVLAYDGHPVPVTGKMATAKSRLPGLPDNWRELVDEHTDTIFVWVRQSTKVDSATGRKNLDETKRVVLWAYKNPRPAEWPAADFIVGNPPFIGKSRLRESLGDGYAETLRSLYPAVPDSGDFVMFWWDKAASLARAGNIRRFGFITTNSIKQTFNRRVVEHHLSAKPPLSLLFAIPDHPWVDPSEADEEKASVRIAMTVGAAGEHKGELMTVIDEHEEKDGSAAVTLSSAHGLLHADLTVGVNVGALRPLKSNEGLTSMGMMLAGSGFILSQSETEELLKKEPKAVGTVVRRYRNGRDLTDQPREASVIDFCGLSTDEARSPRRTRPSTMPRSSPRSGNCTTTWIKPWTTPMAGRGRWTTRKSSSASSISTPRVRRRKRRASSGGSAPTTRQKANSSLRVAAPTPVNRRVKRRKKPASGPGQRCSPNASRPSKLRSPKPNVRSPPPRSRRNLPGPGKPTSRRFSQPSGRSAAPAPVTPRARSCGDRHGHPITHAYQRRWPAPVLVATQPAGQDGRDHAGFSALRRVSPAALVALVATVNRWRKEDRQVDFLGLAEYVILGYLQRMGALRTCSVEIPDGFHRHEAKGRLVPYRKGDPVGNRWLDDEPLYIDWSQATVNWLSTSPMTEKLHGVEGKGPFDKF